MSPRKKIQQISIGMAVVILVVAALIQVFQPSEPTNSADVPSGATDVSASEPEQTNLSLPGWLHIYFTNPNPPDNLGHGIDQYVQPAIDSAATSIDAASFDLNLPDLVKALASAKKRGVTVRVVYDGVNGNLDLENDATGNKPFNAIKTLKAAGVKLVDGGRSNGLMHDKFLIIDGKMLFVGSWNLAYNDTYRNNNNLLEISDSRLIANYQTKFNELFVDKLFGTHAEVQVPNPELTISGTTVENYFSPTDHVMERLIQYVQDAQKSVHFMAFTYTDKDLANAMIAQAQAGLDVQGVIENRASSQGALPVLFCAGVPVKTDGNKYTMHHKVIIIDGKIVVTGSFNFTNAADHDNDDNIIVLHSPAAAQLYEQEYQTVNAAGQAPPTADVKCK